MSKEYKVGNRAIVRTAGRPYMECVLLDDEGLFWYPLGLPAEECEVLMELNPPSESERKAFIDHARKLRCYDYTERVADVWAARAIV